MNMQKLLKNIIEGQQDFEPASNSEADIREFQPIARLILKAEKEGYVTDVRPHQESETGNNFYDTVIVGGITKAGRQAAV